MVQPDGIVEVRPNKEWFDATEGDVLLGGELIGERIPILKIKYTTAKLTPVRKEPYLKGVIFLNEQEPPEDKNSIPLPLFYYTEKDKNRVVVERDIPWGKENGVVVLFK
jgi:hypothetical protein